MNLTLKKIDKRQNKLKMDVLSNHYGLFLKKKLIQNKIDAKNRPKSLIFSREEASKKNVSQFIVEVRFYLSSAGISLRIIGPRSRRSITIQRTHQFCHRRRYQWTTQDSWIPHPSVSKRKSFPHQKNNIFTEQIFLNFLKKSLVLLF